MNKYFSRTDSRKILHSYGETNNFQSMENFELHIKDLKEFNANFLYMYEIMGREARSLTSLSQFLATEILNANNLTVSDVILKNTTVSIFLNCLFGFWLGNGAFSFFIRVQW